MQSERVRECRVTPFCCVCVCVILTSYRVKLVCSRFRQTVLCVYESFPKPHRQQRGTLENNQTSLEKSKQGEEKGGKADLKKKVS